MKIDKEEVLYIAKLAKLKFTEEEALELASEFEGVLKHFDSLKGTDLELQNYEDSEDFIITDFRDDVVEHFEDNDKLFSNFKDVKDRYVRIPKVIE